MVLSFVIGLGHQLFYVLILQEFLDLFIDRLSIGFQFLELDQRDLGVTLDAAASRPVEEQLHHVELTIIVFVLLTIHIHLLRHAGTKTEP